MHWNLVKKKTKVFAFVAAVFLCLYFMFLFASHPDESKSLFATHPDESKSYATAEITSIKLMSLDVQFYGNQSKLKCDNGTKLLILIPTRPNAIQTRTILRNTWLMNISSDVTYRFVIGSTENKTIEKQNYFEFELFNDIILTNVHDSYDNMSLKVYTYFKWQQQYCSAVEWVLKTDDDTIVHIPRLQYWIEKDFNGLKKQYDEKLIIGHMWQNARVRRSKSSKWYISEKEYKNEYYPEYANGATYILTSKTIKSLLKEMPNQTLIKVDDVYFTGIVAESAGIARIDRSSHFAVVERHFPSSFKCDEKGVPYFTAMYVDTDNLKMSNDLLELHGNLKSFPCRKWYHYFWYY